MRFLLKIILWGSHISIGLWALIIMCFHIKNQTLPDEGQRAMTIFIGNLILIIYALLVAYIY